MVYNTRTFALTENCFNNDTIPDVDTSNVPDNIDEAVSTILYETEINYNRLMNVSGVFGSGFVNENVITEAVDLKSFFAKIKAFFKNLLEKIVKLFKKIMEKAKEFFKNIFSKNKKPNDSSNNNQKNNTWKYITSTSKEDNNYSDENKSSDVKMLGYTDILALPQKEYNDITYKGYNYTHIEKDSEINIENIATDVQHVIFDLFDEIGCIGTHNFLKLDDNAMQNIEKEAIKVYNKANSLDFKNTMQKKIYSTILGKDVQSVEQNAWKKELFKYFRDGQDSPTELIMRDSDIAIYQEAIRNGEDDIKYRLKYSYSNIDRYVARWDTLPPKRYYYADDHKKDIVDRYHYELAQCEYYYRKQLVIACTEFATAQTNAIIEQCSQYKRALTQMLNQ